MIAHGYFDTPQDVKRRTAHKAPKKQAMGRDTRAFIEAVAASIEIHGWDRFNKNLYWHTHRIRSKVERERAMQYLYEGLGRSVVPWEDEPGRTQEQVLNLIREVIR